MFSWLSYNRPDIVWLKGPDANGAYHWDLSLPNQTEITDLIDSYDPDWQHPPEVPETISPRQFRLAFLSSGHDLSVIDAIIDSLPEPDKTLTKISYEYANEIERYNPLVLGMGATLEISEAETDSIFILGAGL